MKKHVWTKMLSLALVLVCVLGLAACGGDDGGSKAAGTYRLQNIDMGGLRPDTLPINFVHREDKTFHPCFPVPLYHILSADLQSDKPPFFLYLPICIKKVPLHHNLPNHKLSSLSRGASSPFILPFSTVTSASATLPPVNRSGHLHTLV